MLTVAIPWEERAREMLSHGAPISDFEDIIRFNNAADGLFFIFFIGSWRCFIFIASTRLYLKRT